MKKLIKQVKKGLAALMAAVIVAVFMPLGLEVRAEGEGEGRIVTIYTNEFRTMAITADGTLWRWGQRHIGDGEGCYYISRYRYRPQPVMENVTAVSTSGGGGLTMAITTDGTLWGWGANNNGQLGIEGIGWSETPVRIMENVTAVSTSGGGGHTMAITADGTLWGWGNNSRGQLGDGTTENRHSPVPIIENVTAVSTGLNRTFAITADGTLWGWGSNQYGTIGDGTTTDRHSPVHIMENVKAVSAALFHTMAITTDGTLWGWGLNRDRQLGDGTTENRHSPVHIMENVKAVSAGHRRTLAITTDDALWRLSGVNRIPERIMENVSAVSVSNRHDMVLTADGALWGWGENTSGEVGVGPNHPAMEEVAGGALRINHPVFVMDNIMLPTETQAPTAPISLTVNNTSIIFNNPPITRYDFVFFEVDEIFSALADSIYWDEATRTVSAGHGNYIIGIQIDYLIYIANGETLSHRAELTPFFYNGMIYVCIDTIVTGLGLSSSWDGATRTIGIIR